MKIANCKCGSVPEMGHAENFYGSVSVYWYYCEEKETCGICGPSRKMPEEALAAWNELIDKAAEPAAGSARKIVQISTTDKGATVFCDDSAIFTFSPSKWRWIQLPPLPGGADNPLPQPAEIKGSVE